MEKLWRCPIRGENLFLSTPSARRATTRQPLLRRHGSISIHTLREEGDLRQPRKAYCLRDFYPRPPRGGRPASVAFAAAVSLFLSTPSARRATLPQCRLLPPFCISIHALREEGDRLRVLAFGSLRNFYPRPPRGGRQQKQRQNLYFLINYTTFCTDLEEL